MTTDPDNSTSTFGQRIETALASAWSGVEAEGRVLLADAGQFGERELGVVEKAIVNTWNIEDVAESVVAQGAAGASSLLGGAVSAGLKAVVAGLIASL